MLNSLNPCFSGTYSQRRYDEQRFTFIVSLNPCFSGTYSQSGNEDAASTNFFDVLILVLVEHTLREAGYYYFATENMRLNPCFSGTYSQRVGDW